ncbi:MAG: ABC transporter ATP-binding protein [Mariniblastus sp.]|nr:ABC transporter ATP-binding protein [Mariniblastus sp.]
MSIPAVTITALSKSFGDLRAVDDLSFSVQNGETFGLLGPNGAGKTTTISLLIGLLRPDHGSVVLGKTESRDPGNPAFATVRQSVGVAPQALSIYEALTAKENLEFFGQLYGLSGAKLKERVAWCLDFAQLAERAKTRAGTFSGGMKRRLNMAVALIHEPSILLLDEPTVGVDPQSRNHIFESIQTLREQGMTILYTTHYMEEAQRLCERVAIMDHGKLLAMDTVENLLSQFGGDSIITADLQSIPSGVEIPGARSGNRIRFVAPRPLEEVAKLSSKGVAFQTLNVIQPDLESVFLKLTGRNLRDG